MEPKAKSRLNLWPLLAKTGVSQTTMRCGPRETIFARGDVADSIMYVQTGTIKLSVFSKVGREGVVAMLTAGDFFGEECLADQPTRKKNATTITRSVVLVIKKADMLRLLRTHQALSDRFLAHMLVRKTRLEEDLVDHRVNSAEQRLARKLLLLARIGNRTISKRIVPSISQSTLAGMVGITCSRVSLLLNRFRRLGYIDLGHGLLVNRSLRRAFGNGAVVKLPPARHRAAAIRLARTRLAVS